MRCVHTVVAIVLSLIVWILLHIPLAFLWKPVTVHCPIGDIYLLNVGVFADDKTMKLAFTYLWAILGFAVPVVLLGYCNVKLIYSLHASQKMRSQESGSNSQQKKYPRQSLLRKDSPVSQRSTADKGQRRLTCSLIAIVVMFFVCVFPSEIIQFYEDIFKPDFRGFFQYALIVGNLLQAFNFSSNFALYCVVNAYFRKTVKEWFRCGRKEAEPLQKQTRSKVSLGSSSTKTSYT